MTITNISAFKEVSRVLRENFPYYTGWRFVKKKDGTPHYCALAYLEKKKGYSDWRIRLNLIDNILEKYGLSHDESIKERLCLVDGCCKTGSLVDLIGHMNAGHKMPADQIADAIEK